MIAKNVDKIVNDKIYKEVFINFGKGEFQEGYKTLKKLYLQYNNRIENLETKRLLVQNLAWVENRLNNKEKAKEYILKIRELIESDLEYIYSHKLQYCKLLNFYVEIFENEVDDNEYISIQIFNQNTYDEIGAFGEYVVAKVNVYFKLKKYDEIVVAIKDLNDKKNKDNNYEYYANEILEELKKHSLEHYKEALNIIRVINLKGGEV